MHKQPGKNTPSPLLQGTCFEHYAIVSSSFAHFLSGSPLHNNSSHKGRECLLASTHVHFGG